MHDELTSFKQKIHPKNFKQTSIILKNPKVYQKNPKVRSKGWNAWKSVRKQIILEEEITIEWRRGFEWEKRVWEKEERVSIKINWRKWEKNRVDPFYRNPSFSMDWEVSSIKIFKISCRGAIEELMRGVHSKVTSMDREAFEHLLSIQKLPRWIE